MYLQLGFCYFANVFLDNIFKLFAGGQLYKIRRDRVSRLSNQLKIMYPWSYIKGKLSTNRKS